MTTPDLLDHTGTDDLEHLDWQPACTAILCRHGHPPATHILRLVAQHSICRCSNRTILLCAFCAPRVAEFWSMTEQVSYTCAACHTRATVFPALDGRVDRL